MEFSKEDIAKALDFYNIQNNEYIEKVYMCLEYVNMHKTLKDRVNKVLDLLYVNTPEDLRSRWKVCTKEEIFGCNVPEYITNLVLLLGYKFHIKNMDKFSLEERKISTYRVRNSLLSNIADITKGIRVSQMLWGAYIIDIRIIDVGRLQYEREYINPVTKKKEDVIKIHIPQGGKLEYDEVKKSLEKSKEYVKKHFGLENVDYYCDSWLLSKDVLNLLKKDSNIYKFNTLFEALKTEDGMKDVLKFVFNISNTTDYTKLKEDTTLRKGLKEKILKGEKIYKEVARLVYFD